MPEKQAPLYKVVGVVLLYWCTSWAAIFMNKFVYTNLKKSFDAPYFITLVQFISPTVSLYAYSKINRKITLTPGFPNIKFSGTLALRVFPLSILFCLMVTMSNLCLKYVEVSFYQISRSLGIPMIPLINYLLFGERSSLRTVLSCIVIVIGWGLVVCFTSDTRPEWTASSTSRCAARCSGWARVRWARSTPST